MTEFLGFGGGELCDAVLDQVFGNRPRNGRGFD